MRDSAASWLASLRSLLHFPFLLSRLWIHHNSSHAEFSVYRPTPGSDRGVDLGGTFVYSPADKGFLPYNRQLVLTAEFNGFIPRRSKDSINFAFDYLGIRGPLQTPNCQSEKVYELDYSFQVNRWLKWIPDLQFHQDIDANPANGIGVIVGFRSLITF
jgi:hypothetical protein